MNLALYLARELVQRWLAKASWPQSSKKNLDPPARSPPVRSPARSLEMQKQEFLNRELLTEIQMVP
jgi:hypothetical protein